MKTTVFNEVKRNLELIDSLVFNNQKTKTIELSVEQLSKTYKGELVAAYLPGTDSYGIHPRLKTIVKKDFIEEFSTIRSGKILNTIFPCYLNEEMELYGIPEFPELPEKSFEYLVASICAHEIRHRIQVIRNLDRSFLHDYETEKEFNLFYKFNNFYIKKLIDNGFYSLELYPIELDAMMIEEIFLYELWLAEENGMTFNQGIEKASQIISMNSIELQSRLRLHQFCYLGKNYFNFS
jgi:hypothetical protein